MSEEKKEVNLNFNDGLENVASGLGTSMDKSTYNEWKLSGRNQNWEQLMARYREDWVAQKVCNIVPQDMTRTWRMIDTEEGIKADKQFRISDLFREAGRWARCLGTSFLLIDVADGKGLEEPLDLDNLKPGCLKSLRVIERQRMATTGTMETDPMSPEFGLPVFYQFLGSEKMIHRSRVIRFEGTELPLWDKQRNQWFSDSILIPLWNTIDNFHVAASEASQMVQEANVDVVQVEGLQQLLTNPEGEAAVMKRFRLMKQMKSNHNILVLDSTEEFDTKKLSLSGVKDLIWEYLKIVAAAVGIPATRFLSASPDGMNATGESDLINYVEMLMGLQVSLYDPRLVIVDKLLQAHYGIEEYSYEWNCIFPESEGQAEERKSKVVDQVATLVEKGVIDNESAVAILKKKKVYEGVELKTPSKEDNPLITPEPTEVKPESKQEN